MKRVVFILLAAGALLVPLLASAGHPSRRHLSPAAEARLAARRGIHKIRHVVVIMQENRSFDSYFGTYPGADGIPGLAGNPGPLPCVPDPDRNMCETPFHDVTDRDAGGPHGHGTALADIADGRMDGFIGQAELGRTSYCKKHFDDPRCSFMPGKPDVMGYHDWREIPNYWDYASNFVLQDHMFESDSSWSLPQHLYMVSGWSARCTKTGDPMSCHNSNTPPERKPGDETPAPTLRERDVFVVAPTCRHSCQCVLGGNRVTLAKSKVEPVQNDERRRVWVFGEGCFNCRV